MRYRIHARELLYHEGTIEVEAQNRAEALAQVSLLYSNRTLKLEQPDELAGELRRGGIDFTQLEVAEPEGWHQLEIPSQRKLSYAIMKLLDQQR